MAPSTTGRKPTGVNYTDKVTVEQHGARWRGYSETFGVAVYAASRPAAEKRLSSAVHLLLGHLYETGGIERLIDRLESTGAEYVINFQDNKEIKSLKTRNLELGAVS
jgi:hypothetical protein